MSQYIPNDRTLAVDLWKKIIVSFYMTYVRKICFQPGPISHWKPIYT